MKEDTLNFEVQNADVLIRTEQIGKKTEGGIIKSDSMLEIERATMDGFLEVTSVGPDCKFVKAGDEVLISNGRHTQYDIDGEFYLILSEISILGKRKK